MIGNQPPKNSVDTKALINSILAYSPKKNRAKVIAEYSTLYPETNSASASGKSKGWRFVSASIDTQNKTNIGNKGIKNQIFFWAITIELKLKDPAQTHTLIIMNPIETSYEIIWAAERSAPKNGYFELLDQPAIIIP